MKHEEIKDTLGSIAKYVCKLEEENVALRKAVVYKDERIKELKEELEIEMEHYDIEEYLNRIEELEEENRKMRAVYNKTISMVIEELDNINSHNQLLKQTLDAIRDDNF